MKALEIDISFGGDDFSRHFGLTCERECSENVACLRLMGNAKQVHSRSAVPDPTRATRMFTGCEWQSEIDMQPSAEPVAMKSKTRIASSDEMCAVADVIRSANPHLESRIRTFLAAGARWHEATPIVCEVSGQIVSCACVFHRRVWTRRGETSFGGIGAVATLPEARGRGYATSVLRKCENFLRGQGYRVALLFCTILDFYARLGWSPVEEDWVEFVLPELPRVAGALSYHLSQPDVAAIPEAVRMLCDQASQPSGSAMVRSDGLWDEYGSWPREDRDLFWAAYRHDQPIAYVRGRRIASGLRLAEITCREGHEEAMLVLLEQQRQVAGGRRDVRYHAFLSGEHPLAGLLKKAGVDPVWRKTGADTEIMMIKDLSGGSPANKGKSPPTGRYLLTDDFKEGLPWRPRTWWAVDRF